VSRPTGASSCARRPGVLSSRAPRGGEVSGVARLSAGVHRDRATGNCERAIVTVSRCCCFGGRCSSPRGWAKVSCYENAPSAVTPDGQTARKLGAAVNGAVASARKLDAVANEAVASARRLGAVANEAVASAREHASSEVTDDVVRLRSQMTARSSSSLRRRRGTRQDTFASSDLPGRRRSCTHDASQILQRSSERTRAPNQPTQNVDCRRQYPIVGLGCQERARRRRRPCTSSGRSSSASSLGSWRAR
jgi:hypothetical protein